MEAAYARARVLCGRVGDPAQLFTALQGLCTFHQTHGDHFEARDLSQELLHLAERSREPALLMRAHFAVGSSAYWRAELGTARAHLEGAVALYEPERHRTHASLHAGADPCVFALGYLSALLAALGHWDQGRARAEEGLQRARELSHPFSIATALFWLAAAHLRAGFHQQALEQAEALTAIATENGFPRWLGVGAYLQACAFVELGQVEEGLARLRPVGDALRAAGLRMGQTLYFLQLAEACSKAGLVAEGLSALDDAVDHVEQTGERILASLVHTTRGDLLARRFQGK